jgi:hypothetical protein
MGLVSSEKMITLGLPPPAHSGGKSWHFQGLDMKGKGKELRMDNSIPSTERRVKENIMENVMEKKGK